jgi:putative copper export protein
VFLAADSIVLALRALSFVAIFQAAGSALFLEIFGARLSPGVDERVRTLARIAGVAALCLTVLNYVLTPARMAGNLGSTFDPSLEALLLDSNAGSAHIVRIIGLAVLFLSLDRRNRLNSIAARAALMLTIVSFALMGHTVIHPLRWLLAPLLLVHVAIAAFWFGALLPLRMIAERESAEQGGATIARFSQLAVWLVPLVLVCGVSISLVFIRSFAELGTAYGAIVLGKTAAFGALMYLATLNKRRYGPLIARADAGALRAFKRTVVFEWGLIAGVLVATALLTSLFAPGHLEGSFGSHLLDTHAPGAAPSPENGGSQP